MDANMSIWNGVKVKREIRRDKNKREIKDGTAAGEGVDENEKNRIIEKAVKKWTEMNMNGTQIAFGIATMNVESGFNYKAKAHSNDPKVKKTASGLGQFTKATWETAVNSYNSKNHAHLNPNSFNWNEDVQIAVMGGWIKVVTERMKLSMHKSMLAEKGDLLLFYGLWHSGAWAEPDTLATFLNPKSATENKLTDEGRKFLIETRDAVKVEVNKRVEEHIAAKQSALSDKEIRKLINQKKEAKRLAFLHKELLKSLAEIKTGIDEAPDISEAPDIIGAYNNLRELIGKSIDQTKDASPLPFVYNEVDKWLHKAKMVLAKKQVKTKSHNETNRESLKRIGDQVYRVEDDGRYRGHFNS